MIPFKKKHWNKEITLFKLSIMLKRHYEAFSLSTQGWTENDIWYFLQIHHWLYPEKYAQKHHYNTIERLLVEAIT